MGITHQLCWPLTPHQPAPSPPAFAPRPGPLPLLPAHPSSHTRCPLIHPQPKAPRLLWPQPAVPVGQWSVWFGSHSQLIQEHSLIWKASKYTHSAKARYLVGCMPPDLPQQSMGVCCGVTIHTGSHCPVFPLTGHAGLSSPRGNCPQPASHRTAFPGDTRLHSAYWLCSVFQSHQVSTPCRVPQRSPEHMLCRWVEDPPKTGMEEAEWPVRG